MNLTESQKKMLTEKLLKECFKPGLVGFPYTFEGETNSNRTFLAAQDLMDCKDMLVKEGLWDKFWGFTLGKYINSGSYLGANFDKTDSYHSGWLFRPTDEKGEAHFCLLVAQFMEAHS